MSLTLYRTGVWAPCGPVELPDTIDPSIIAAAIAELFPDGDKTGDNERDHIVEERLYVYVLECIAQGRCSDPQATAATVLQLRDIEYTRWYA